MAAPVLEGNALRAVRHRGSHLRIIVAAGSGKTEVVSRRVAGLWAERRPPKAIVAFTFTERAAEELTNRMVARVEEQMGSDALDRLGRFFVGTIHAYCFRLLETLERYRLVTHVQQIVRTRGSRVGRDEIGDGG